MEPRSGTISSSSSRGHGTRIGKQLMLAEVWAKRSQAHQHRLRKSDSKLFPAPQGYMVSTCTTLKSRRCHIRDSCLPT